MSVLLSHPTSNESSRAAAAGFYHNNMLGAFYTSMAGFPGGLYAKLSSFDLLAIMKRRMFDPWLEPYTHTHPWRELGRMLALKTGQKKLIEHEKGIFSVDAVYKSIDKYVAKNLHDAAKKDIRAVYAYEDGAYYSFKKARTLGLECIYDLPIGYWRNMHHLLEKEKELHPDWANTLVGFKDSPEKLSRKDEELKLADKIIVASSFTANSLKEFTGSRLLNVVIVPYGFPFAIGKQYRKFKTEQKLKLLFIGSLSQRKGLSYLFEALTGLEAHINLTIVGRQTPYACAPLKKALHQHTSFNSLPHNKILELMREHDVLIFPSLFEGFGLVITEAMSQGTPVITTDRTAGPDIIQHGENGWLVNAGSAEAIKNVLEAVLLRPQLIAGIGEQALKTAAKRPWSVYGKELAGAISGK